MAKISHVTSLAFICGIADSWNCYTVSLGSCYDFAVWGCGGMIAFVKEKRKNIFLNTVFFVHLHRKHGILLKLISREATCFHLVRRRKVADGSYEYTLAKQEFVWPAII